MLSVLMQITAGSFAHEAAHLAETTARFATKTDAAACVVQATPADDDHDHSGGCAWCSAMSTSCLPVAPLLIPQFIPGQCAFLSCHLPIASFVDTTHWGFAVRDPPLVIN
jgi:hypothetical protein